MAYFLEVIERGSIFLSAAGFVSFIVIHSFFCSLDTHTHTDAEGKAIVQRKESGLSFVQRFICHLNGAYDLAEIKPENPNSEATSESSQENQPIKNSGPSFLDRVFCNIKVSSDKNKNTV